MEQFGLDIKLLIAQVTNFLIFLFIFKKFISKPFGNYIANEKKKENEKEKMMKELSERYEKMKEEEKKWQLGMQKEKEAILSETAKIAERLKNDTLAQTKKDSEEILAKAEKQISNERQTLYDDLKRKTVDLSTYMVERGLREYLTEDVQRNLTNHIVNKLGKDVSKYEN